MNTLENDRVAIGWGTRASAPSGTCISVIIPAFNEEKNISACLQALCDLEFRRQELEVIVVDNGSTDKTVEVARSFQKELNIRTLHHPGVRVSALRNLGARAAKGRIFAFLDADCLVSPQWLKVAAPLFTEDEPGIVGGFYGLVEPSSWVAFVWHRYYHEAKTGDVSFLPSGDLFVDRETFDSLGGFDESLETNEDYDFCTRVRLSGRRVRCFEDLTVGHLGTPQTLGAFYRQQRWHGKHVLKVFLREPSRLHNVRALAFGVTALVCLCGVVLSSVYAAVFGNWQYLVGFALATILLPCAVSLRAATRAGHHGDVLRLTVLHAIYGGARAICLLQGVHGARRNRRRASDKGVMPSAAAGQAHST